MNTKKAIDAVISAIGTLSGGVATSMRMHDEVQEYLNTARKALEEFDESLCRPMYIVNSRGERTFKDGEYFYVYSLVEAREIIHSWRYMDWAEMRIVDANSGDVIEIIRKSKNNADE